MTALCSSAAETNALEGSRPLPTKFPVNCRMRVNRRLVGETFMSPVYLSTAANAPGEINPSPTKQQQKRCDLFKQSQRFSYIAL